MGAVNAAMLCALKIFASKQRKHNVCHNFTPMDLKALAKVFRYAGDILAVSSKLALVRKIVNTKSLSGISLKTQVLYLIVYVTRYLDLLHLGGQWDKARMYNQCMKIVYISFQVYLISQFYGPYKYTYSKKYDTFNIPIFLGVSAALSLIFKNDTSTVGEYIEEYAYTISLFLESLAILPQLALSQDSGEIEKLTTISITLLGLYRLNYLVYFLVLIMAKRSMDTLMIVTSLIQSVLYIDFFRIYFGFMKKKDTHI